MPTTKKRINITLPSYLEEALVGFAKKEGVPVATKAVEYLKMAISLEEDCILQEIAEKRDLPDAHFVPHNEIWGS
ncbi:hypothetical protein COB57_04295 [Candidatus Peregrinibacteria bacterium]|nr:MAG: hypothetical protein COB57_04295 [Candidatus Peregrinibacteria bacterium]